MTPTIPTVIDVREYPEFASGHIEGSLSIPLGRLKEASAGWDRTMPLTLICKTGKRSHAARLQLMDMGFTSLNVLEGGIDAWRQAGKPLQFAAKQPWSNSVVRFVARHARRGRFKFAGIDEIRSGKCFGP